MWGGHLARLTKMDNLFVINSSVIDFIIGEIPHQYQLSVTNLQCSSNLRNSLVSADEIAVGSQRLAADINTGRISEIVKKYENNH